jgi:hypothetical protein
LKRERKILQVEREHFSLESGCRDRIRIEVRPGASRKAIRMNEVPVIIAGGGPVGMTLAMDLGWRGVPCLLFEERLPAMPPNPKMQHH